jgi:hypothetical protein
MSSYDIFSSWSSLMSPFFLHNSTDSRYRFLQQIKFPDHLFFQSNNRLIWSAAPTSCTYESNISCTFEHNCQDLMCKTYKKLFRIPCGIIRRTWIPHMQTWNGLFENGQIEWSLYFRKIRIKHWNHIGPTIPLESSPNILLIQLQLMRGFYAFPYRECQKTFLVYLWYLKAGFMKNWTYIYIYI